MWLKYGIGAGVLVILDQITKFLALDRLKPVGNMVVFPGFLDFTFVENRGAAFGLFHGQIWFFIIFTAIILAVIFIAFFKMPISKEYLWLRFSLALVVAGALGNVIDRLFRGYVVDFLEITFISWPVFNLADIYVVCGTTVTAYLISFVIKEEPKIKSDL